MKSGNTENLVFANTAKTVIFVHNANDCVIDDTITRQATYIKLAKEEWKATGESIFYYLREMRKAAASDRDLIIMDYEPVIGAMIEALMKAPGQYNFCDWIFCTFFNADTCPIDDEKLTVLAGLHGFPFIIKYTVPVNYTLTNTDIDQLKLVFKTPASEEELREMITRKREQLFPFYEINDKALIEFIKKQKLK